jgi:hypothetical protein
VLVSLKSADPVKLKEVSATSSKKTDSHLKSFTSESVQKKKSEQLIDFFSSLEEESHAYAQPNYDANAAFWAAPEDPYQHKSPFSSGVDSLRQSDQSPNVSSQGFGVNSNFNTNRSITPFATFPMSNTTINPVMNTTTVSENPSPFSNQKNDNFTIDNVFGSITPVQSSVPMKQNLNTPMAFNHQQTPFQQNHQQTPFQQNQQELPFQNHQQVPFQQNQQLPFQQNQHIPFQQNQHQVPFHHNNQSLNTFTSKSSFVPTAANYNNMGQPFHNTPATPAFSNPFGAQMNSVNNSTAVSPILQPTDLGMHNNPFRQLNQSHTMPQMNSNSLNTSVNQQGKLNDGQIVDHFAALNPFAKPSSSIPMNSLNNNSIGPSAAFQSAPQTTGSFNPFFK